jgi:hypothetical protein
MSALTRRQITANGGFMLTNALSFLSPGPLTLTTPPELLPYGWTTADLWAAPTITGLYAFLTHAQPFWAHTHAALAAFLGAAALQPDAAARVDEKDPALPPASPGVRPMDPETARAACAIVLMCLFTGRAVKNYGGLKAVKSLFGMDASGTWSYQVAGFLVSDAAFFSALEEDAISASTWCTLYASTRTQPLLHQ